ncbi:hypothetical protein BP6252_08807 [Coleophoma cylindrospora]|uniref:Rhodopsin domain-containing protein n=1 Tax=Coleophoma cylindrospora TaxID=1849047 RepID=A0A3D8R710_9HELO|nr:hypothetical protein BP6252_08807 [Coleophoma cylindrospora]
MTGTRQPQLIFSATFSIFLSTVSVALRFVSRKWVVGKISMDDWLMLVSLVAVVASSLFALLLCQVGVGLHLADIKGLDIAWAEHNVRMLLGFQITYNFAVYFAKLSILSFFTMFIPRGTFTRTVTVWTIWAVSLMLPIKLIVFALQCVPFAKAWNPALPGTCVNTEVFLYFVTGYHILTDIIIFVLPIKILASINRKTRDKLLLLALFGVSFFAVVIGCVRVYAMNLSFISSDFTWDEAPILVWSMLEGAVGIFCGSVPAMKPLFSRGQLSQTMTANLELSTAFYELKRRPSSATTLATHV